MSSKNLFKPYKFNLHKIDLRCQLTKKGFTLIELLVVVLIIGILAAVALPQYTKAVEKSRTAEATQVLGDLATAESIYYLGNNKYTDDLTKIDLEFPGLQSNNKTIKTNSYEIVAAVSGTNDSTFTATATRKGGTYDGGTLTIEVDNTGAITRGGTLATGGTVGDSAIPALATTWK